MKKLIYPTIALAAASCFVACVDNEDYADWATPAVNPQTPESEMLTAAFSAQPAAVVDLAAYAEQPDAAAAIFTPSFATGGKTPDAVAYQAIFSVQGQSVALDATEQGAVPVSQLKDVFTTAYGLEPAERVLSAVIVAKATVGGITLKGSDTIDVAVKVHAPFVCETEYYIVVGDDVENAIALSRAEPNMSPYDAPEFTATVSAPFATDGTTRLDYAFRIAPKSGLTDASKILGAVGGEDFYGATAQLTESSFMIVQAAEDAALKYDVTFNAYTRQVTVKPVYFASEIYCAGNHQGWSPANGNVLYSDKNGDNYNGVYRALIYMDGDFKFLEERAWTKEFNADYFTTMEAPFIRGDGSNIKCSTAGLYVVTADLAAKKLSAVVMSKVGIIGSATPGGWDADTDMTYDAEARCYTLTAALTAGEFKFRMGGEWSLPNGYNLGGVALNDLVYNGSNLAIAEAGTYTVKLFIGGQAENGGKPYATVTLAE